MPTIYQEFQCSPSHPMWAPTFAWFNFLHVIRPHMNRKLPKYHCSCSVWFTMWNSWIFFFFLLVKRENDELNQSMKSVPEKNVYQREDKFQRVSSKNLTWKLLISPKHLPLHSHPLGYAQIQYSLRWSTSWSPVQPAWFI